MMQEARQPPSVTLARKWDGPYNEKEGNNWRRQGKDGTHVKAIPPGRRQTVKIETQALLERAPQSDALLYDTGTYISAERAWKALAAEDATLRGKTGEAFARWLRQRGLFSYAGQYAPFPSRPREKRPLYRLADLLALLEQLPTLKAQFSTAEKRRAAARAAHPRAATLRAAQTRQASKEAIAGFDAESLALLERFRRLKYPRAAAIRAIQKKPHGRLLALLERVDAGVQAGTLDHPAAYLAATLAERPGESGGAA
jgi:hypothetical protein